MIPQPPRRANRKRLRPGPAPEGAGEAADAERGAVRREEALATSCLTEEETETLVKLLLKIKENLVGDESEDDKF